MTAPILTEQDANDAMTTVTEALRKGLINYEQAMALYWMVRRVMGYRLSTSDLAL